MKKLPLALLGSALVLSTLAAARMGGWAVVSVENPPDYLVAGKPTELTFTVRQHAVTLLSDLTPSIEAKAGRQRVKGMTWRLKQAGGYGARVTVPTAGAWQITINSGFGRSRLTLVPVQAIDAAARTPAPLQDSERGRRLFAAKGCVTCHVHGGVDIAGDMKDFGPDLTDRRFPAEYLAAFLADPSIKPPTNGKPRMPNFALKQPEIASLVAFINSERKLSSH
jgi:mono/diheme cytochrome c family protein